MPVTPVHRLAATPAAAALVASLRQRHGEVFFYLSHGCCDGSSPLCLAPGEMSLSATDVQLGTVAGAAFWLSQAQRDYLASLQLTLDVAPGSNGGFSLEDGSGQRFVLAMRLFSDDELVHLAHLAQVGTLSAAQSPGAAAAPGPVPTAKS